MQQITITIRVDYVSQSQYSVRIIRISEAVNDAMIGSEVSRMVHTLVARVRFISLEVLIRFILKIYEVQENLCEILAQQVLICIALKINESRLSFFICALVVNIALFLALRDTDISLRDELHLTVYYFSVSDMCR